jgi:hypothetical protein
MHSGTAGQAGVPGEQLVAGLKTFIREGGEKANIFNYYTRRQECRQRATLNCVGLCMRTPAAAISKKRLAIPSAQDEQRPLLWAHARSGESTGHYEERNSHRNHQRYNLDTAQSLPFLLF